jgi:hypothetical protein
VRWLLGKWVEGSGKLEELGYFAPTVVAVVVWTIEVALVRMVIFVGLALLWPATHLDRSSAYQEGFSDQTMLASAFVDRYQQDSRRPFAYRVI